MGNKVKVLVADDEPNIRMFLRANLQARGYETYLAQNGAEAIEMAERYLPDIIILDIAMPLLDGLEVCRRLRAWTDTPIIVLSVRRDEQEKVRALNEGADDYVTKPFGIEELLARIKVALRHAVAHDVAAPLFTAGDLEIDLAQGTVKRRGQPVKLTRTEYRLLAYLAANCDKTLTYTDILRNIWGFEYGQEREYVRVFIGQLRHKIEDDPLAPKFILTEQRMGYRFHKPA